MPAIFRFFWLLCAVFMSVNIVTSLVFVASWVSLLFWIWRGRGAEFLARVGPALTSHPSSDRTYSPGLVRAFITMLVVISAVGAGVAWRSMPVSPDMACATVGSSG